MKKSHGFLKIAFVFLSFLSYANPSLAVKPTETPKGAFPDVIEICDLFGPDNFMAQSQFPSTMKIYGPVSFHNLDLSQARVQILGGSAFLKGVNCGKLDILGGALSADSKSNLHNLYIQGPSRLTDVTLHGDCRFNGDLNAQECDFRCPEIIVKDGSVTIRKSMISGNLRIISAQHMTLVLEDVKIQGDVRVESSGHHDVILRNSDVLGSLTLGDKGRLHRCRKSTIHGSTSAKTVISTETEKTNSRAG